LGATRLFTVRSISRAASALIPRIKSTTSRAFCGDIRMYLASALIVKTLDVGCRISDVGFRENPLPGSNLSEIRNPTSEILLSWLSRFLRRRLYRVALECPGRRKLA